MFLSHIDASLPLSLSLSLKSMVMYLNEDKKTLLKVFSKTCEVYTCEFHVLTNVNLLLPHPVYYSTLRKQTGEPRWRHR